jgi:hypothetical protein
MTAWKLHLRVVEVNRKILRVVSPRPQLGARFSTNYFHDTWHILAGPDGAAVLGRLLWGLAFQRLPGTLILIDGAHLVSTPFEGDAADPIALVPTDITHVDADDLRALRQRLRRSPPAPTTIRWHTAGMAEALAAPHAPGGWRRRWRDPIWQREHMTQRAGCVCYAAPGPVLRARALGIHQMGGDGYFPLAEQRRGQWRYDGEVQVIDDFAGEVAAARQARRQLAPDARGLLAGTAAAWEIANEAHRRARRRQDTRRGGPASRGPARTP